MRDRNFNSSDFISGLERYMTRFRTKLELLRSDVVDNPNFSYDSFVFNVSTLGPDEVLGLALLSWYAPREVSLYLRMDLEKRIKQFLLEDQAKISLCLSSKGTCLNFLQETTLWHSRDFFGNILDKLSRRLRVLRIMRPKRKVKRPQRKRGYHDHGSRVPEHRWKPKSDYELVMKQNQIELERLALKDTISFMEGWLL